MAEANDDQQNPNAQGAGNAGGDDRKLYAGKFKSPEDLEKSYGELEKSFHATRQEYKSIKDEVSALKESLAQQTTQRGYATVPADTDANTKVLQAFYENPVGVLREVVNTAKKEWLMEQERQRVTVTREAEIVQDWTKENPDVVQYQDLLSFYVTQADPRASTRDKLNDAAKKVRARVLELRKAPGSSGPKPEDHVEAPAGGNPQAGGSAPRTQAFDPEAALKAEIARRNAERKPQKPAI